MKMYVKYMDEIGVVVEEVSEDGIGFVCGMAYFNDKKVLVSNLLEVNMLQKGEQNGI